MLRMYTVCLCAADNKPLPPSLQKKKGLYDLLNKFGVLLDINYFDKKNGKLPGVVFCRFLKQGSARAAIKGVSDIEVEGTRIFCREEIELEKRKMTSKTNICIQDVSEEVTKEVLYRHVSRFGTVLSIKKLVNRNGYCVNFSSPIAVYRYRYLKDVLTLDDDELYINNDDITVKTFEEEEDFVLNTSSESSEVHEEKTEKSNALKTSLIVISSVLLTVSLISFIRRRKTH